MMEAEEPVGRKLVVAMKSRLSVELGDDLRNMQKIKLSKAVDKIAAEVDSALNGNQMSFDIAEIWKGYYAGSKVHQLASSAGAAYRAQGWRK